MYTRLISPRVNSFLLPPPPPVCLPKMEIFGYVSGQIGSIEPLGELLHHEDVQPTHDVIGPPPSRNPWNRNAKRDGCVPVTFSCDCTCRWECASRVVKRHNDRRNGGGFLSKCDAVSSSEMVQRCSFGTWRGTKKWKQRWKLYPRFYFWVEGPSGMCENSLGKTAASIPFVLLVLSYRWLILSDKKWSCFEAKLQLHFSEWKIGLP